MPQICPQCKTDGYEVYITQKEKRDKSGTYNVNQDGSYHTIPCKKDDGGTKWVHVFNKAEYEFAKLHNGISGYPRTVGAQSTQLTTPVATTCSYIGKIEDFKLSPETLAKIQAFEDLIQVGWIKAIEIQEKIQPGLDERTKGAARGNILNLFMEFLIKQQKA